MAQRERAHLTMQEMHFDPLEEEIATHSSILAWKSHSCREIPWTEEPGGLQSMGSQRVGQDFVTK